MKARKWMLGVVLAGLTGPATIAQGAPQWPDTELSRRVQAWFAQLSASEADARTYFRANLSPAALKEASADLRVEQRKEMIERSGGLTPTEVVEASPTHVVVRAKAGNGNDILLTVDSEAEAPYLIKTIVLSKAVPSETPPPGPPGSPVPGSPPTGRGRMSPGRMPLPPGMAPPPAAKPATPEPSGPPLTDAEAVRAIRKQLVASAASGKFSGAVLLARKGKVLLREAWGLADREKKTPIAPGTRFNVGSLGKIFTRAAVAQLVERRKLSLSDSLAKYLPDFPHANEITIQMLAANRSGVGDIFNEEYRTMDRSKLRHNRDYLALIRDQPLWFDPGKDQRYSNGGYVLLGEVVAKASGLDYYDYLAQHVFGPAGMKATSAPVEGDSTPNVARGYTTLGAPPGQELDNVSTRPWRGSAAGGSYSTVDDLLAFDQALLGSRLCSWRWVSWVCEGPSIEGGKMGFGFAGGAPGIASDWEHEGDLVLIVLTNRDPAVTDAELAPVKDAFHRMKP